MMSDFGGGDLLSSHHRPSGEIEVGEERLENSGSIVKTGMVLPVAKG